MLRLELRRRLPEQLPALHRLAAGWLSEHGEIVDAIRHTQAAGDWSDAARLLADHSFGLTLDGQAQTIQSLLRAFPPGAVTEGPDIPLARATNELARGHLDEAAAYLTVAETSIAATPVDRQHRLEVATAALRLSLARKRGHLAGVVDQVRFLASPATGQSDEDIALDSDLRAVALMNLGTVEAWSLGNQDSQRHLQEGADLARRIGRPYLEVACLAELAFASKIEPFATTRRRCREAIALAEQHGWGAEPVLRTLRQSRLLHGQVIFARGLSSPALCRLVAHARALLMPSFAEGFGLPIIEALSVGTPVIASDLPAHREIAGELAIYRDPTDAPGWLAAICMFADGNGVAAEISRRVAAYQPATWGQYFLRIERFLKTFA